MAITSIEDVKLAIEAVKKSLRPEKDSIIKKLADWEHTQFLIGEKAYIIKDLSKMDERRSVFEQDLALLMEKQDVKATNELSARLLKIEAGLVSLGQLRDLNLLVLTRLKRDMNKAQAEAVRVRQTADEVEYRFRQELDHVATRLNDLLQI